MGFIKCADITCDGDGSNGEGHDGRCLNVSGTHIGTVTEARDWAKSEGWVRRDGLDLCPDCKEEQS